MVHSVGALRFSAFVLLLITQATRLDAGAGRWSRIGPFADGGLATALAIDPQHPDSVYVGTTGGIFKSSNGGADWKSVNDGLSGTITGLVVVPGSGETLYATSFSDGVFKTTDGGDHWRAINTGLAGPSSGNTPVSSIAIDRLSPSTLYVGTSGYPGGMFKSIDGGETWAELPLDRNPAVHAIAVDPVDTSRVFVATSLGVYLSEDGGAIWESRNNGLGLQDDNLGGSEVTLVEIDPMSAQTLFAGTLKGVFRSTDGGVVWSSINGGLPPGFRPLALAFSGSTGYVSVDSRGVFRSTDGGTNWVPAGAGLRSPYVGDLAIDPRGDSTLYAAMQLLADGCVAKSTDGATSWRTLPGRFRPLRVLDLALDQNFPSKLYSATEVGVLRSDDAGASWVGPGFDFPPAEAWRLAIDLRSSAVYATTDSPAGLFKTSDEGSHWFRVGGGLPLGHSIFSLTVVPTAPASVLYAGVGYSGVFKSTDAGETWTSLGPVETTVTSVTGDARFPFLIYAGTREGRIFRSSDGGASWATVYNQSYRGICCLNIDPITPTTIYAGWGYSGPLPGSTNRAGGILKSVDSGATWRELPGAPSWAVGAMAIDPRFPSRIFAGTISGIVRSVDGGETWTPLADGLPQWSFIQAIAIEPQATNRTYAGVVESGGGGVFQMTLPPDRGVPVLPCRGLACPVGPGDRTHPRVIPPRSSPPQNP